MTLLQTWVATPAAHALGWTIFHSLWQGAIAALLLAAGLALVRSSRARYALACLSMLAMLAAFILTFALLMPRQQALVSPAADGVPISRIPIGVPFPKAPADWRSILAPVLPWMAPLWLAGVVVFHLHGLASWLAARRLRRTGVCCASDPWPDRLHRLRARLRLSRPVTLLESCFAEVPVVIGHLRPVILLPLGVLANLPPDQIEAILLHELAHIRRFDYLVNLVQTAVEGLLFYHPAIWWISRVIRAERENCCDDLVVATSGDAHAYAVALAQLEQNRSAALETALAATGGSLVKRIRRLLHQPEGPRPSLTPVLSAGLLTLAAALALTAWQSKPVKDLPRPPVQTLAPAESPYSRWLNEDVVYLIDDRERAAFESLRTDEERKHFIEQFWLRRDPTPGTVENEFKQEHYRRIAYANAHFGTADTPGWQTDRGRIYILYGPPDEIESHPKGGPAPKFPPYPFEQWLYRHIQGVGDNVVIDFADPDRSGDYRMTRDPKTSPVAADGRVTSGTGTATISIPLNADAGHKFTVYGVINTPEPRAVASFQEPADGSTALFTKSLSLPAGSYRVRLSVKDLTTGALWNRTIPFEVK